MTTVCFDRETIHVPVWVTDLESFRRWVRSDEVPESLPMFFLNGEVWIDMSKEQLFSHGRLKGEIARVLSNIAKERRSGVVFPDGVLLTNVAADLSGNPDLTYVLKSPHLRFFVPVDS